MRRTNKLLKALKGWEFDIGALSASESMKEGERFSLSSKMSRAFLAKKTIYNKENSHESMFKM